MIPINYETHPDLYFDYRKTLDFLGSINPDDYEYPEEVTNFHVYTEARSPKELESIKSYIATQNLDKTKLTVWSEYDIIVLMKLQKTHLLRVMRHILMYLTMIGIGCRVELCDF